MTDRPSGDSNIDLDTSPKVREIAVHGACMPIQISMTASLGNKSLPSVEGLSGGPTST